MASLSDNSEIRSRKEADLPAEMSTWTMPVPSSARIPFIESAAEIRIVLHFCS